MREFFPLILVTSVWIFALAACGGATLQPTANATVITAQGDIKSKVDEYKALFGQDNVGNPGSQASGFRTITWDSVPDELASPNNLPPDFFNDANAPRARGANLSTPGTGVQASAKPGNPANTAPRFGNLNPQYATLFKTFSPERLFSPVGSNAVDLTFLVPGTKTPAVTRGFGAVYTNVRIQKTDFEFFDSAGKSLGKFPVPLAKDGLSFLGIAFPTAIVARVHIAYGTNALGPNDASDVNVAVMDDFIYSEPQAVR